VFLLLLLLSVLVFGVEMEEEELHPDGCKNAIDTSIQTLYAYQCACKATKGGRPKGNSIEGQVVDIIADVSAKCTLEYMNARTNMSFMDKLFNPTVVSAFRSTLLICETAGANYIKALENLLRQFRIHQLPEHHEDALCNAIDSGFKVSLARSQLFTMYQHLMSIVRMIHTKLDELVTLHEHVQHCNLLQQHLQSSAKDIFQESKYEARLCMYYLNKTIEHFGIMDVSDIQAVQIHRLNGDTLWPTDVFSDMKHSLRTTYYLGLQGYTEQHKKHLQPLLVSYFRCCSQSPRVSHCYTMLGLTEALQHLMTPVVCIHPMNCHPLSGDAWTTSEYMKWKLLPHWSRLMLGVRMRVALIDIKDVTQAHKPGTLLGLPNVLLQRISKFWFVQEEWFLTTAERERISDIECAKAKKEQEEEEAEALKAAAAAAAVAEATERLSADVEMRVNQQIGTRGILRPEWGLFDMYDRDH